MSREESPRLADVLGKRAEVIANMLALFEELRTKERQRVYFDVRAVPNETQIEARDRRNDNETDV